MVGLLLGRVGRVTTSVCPKRCHKMVNDRPSEAIDRNVVAIQPIYSGPNEIPVWCKDVGVRVEGGGYLPGTVRAAAQHYPAKDDCAEDTDDQEDQNRNNREDKR